MLKNYFETEDFNNIWHKERENKHLNVNYRLKKIIYDENSPFQHIVVADSYDFGRMLILDSAVQTTTVDGFIYNEMITHIPICSHPNPESVLIIGGGDCGAVNEVAKYPNIKRIDMVEIDEMVVKVSKKYLKEISGEKSDERVNFIFTDGIKYAKECKELYDIVIIDSSDPVGPAVELFSQEFYKNIYKILKEDGIFTCQSESPIFYGDFTKRIYKSLKNIYKDIKPYTAVVPTYTGGLFSFTMASEKELNTDAKRLKGDNQYVNEDILKSCFALPEYIRKTLV